MYYKPETPRTDRELLPVVGNNRATVYADFARNLETELAALIDREHALSNELAETKLRFAAVTTALHHCLAATGDEAGDIDDFRALLDRENVTVNAVKELRAELAATTREAEEAKRSEGDVRQILDTYAGIEDECAELRRQLTEAQNAHQNQVTLGVEYLEKITQLQAREKALRDALTQIFQWWDMNDGHLITNYPIPVALGMASIRVALAQPTQASDAGG